MDINLKVISETLFLPLYSRALYHPFYPDHKAIEIIKQIEYDFEELKQKTADCIFFSVGRAIAFDSKINDFLSEKFNVAGVIIDMGCGLDTIYYRNKLKPSLWVNIDLNKVIQIRNCLIEKEIDHSRESIILNLPIDVFNEDWFENFKIKIIDKAIFLAGGLFLYYEKEKIKELLINMAEHFPGCELVFDCSPQLVVSTMNQHAEDMGLKNFNFKFSLDDPIELEAWSPKIKVLSSSPHFHELLKCDSIPYNDKARAIKYSELNKSKIVHIKFVA